MASVERSTDLIEERSETAVYWGAGALAFFFIGGIFWYFQRDGGTMIYLGMLLCLMGFGCAAYAVYSLLQIRKVAHFDYKCPYCEATNHLSAEPAVDFTCIDCHRLIPVDELKVLSVYRVLCGYCREPNHYSDKTIVLLCEKCNHEIPITRADGSVAHSQFAVQDDARTYELELTGFEHVTEELVSCLQQMLALNRNQVKDMLTSLPCTLLTGIPKKKAEMLAAQLAVHNAAANFRPL